MPRREWLLPALLVLAAWVRLAHLSDNPGWDGDEGYNWSIAANLAAGHVQRFGLQYTFVDHPPLFYLLGAAIYKLWPGDLLTLRVLSVLCGVATVATLYGLGRRIGGPRLALAAGAAYALWPQAVLQDRWAYTYNLLALLVPLLLWALLCARNEIPWQAGTPLRPQSPPPELMSRRGRVLLWALGCGLLTGLAMATDQEGAALLLGLIPILWWEGVDALLLGLVGAATAPLLYLSWVLINRPTALLFDLRHTAGRLGQGSTTDQLLSLPQRLVHLTSFDPLITLGLLGLALLPRALGRRRAACWLCLAGLLVLALKVRDPDPFLRAAIPLLPCSALGLGLLACRFLDAVRQRARLARGLLALMFLLTLLYDLGQAYGRFSTAIAPFLPQSSSEARIMAAWVNGRIHKDDLVIAMPQIAWLLHCRTAELLESVAVSGHGTAFYPDGLGPGRFAYDPRLQAANLLVVDRFTRLWIVDHPAERALVRRAETTWRRAWTGGEYSIYANPSRGAAATQIGYTWTPIAR
jgi:4-amino-4-deoxy-L-arabinose transferase-like glycosyltransferase